MNLTKRAFKKLTTKPVWYWERHRPYFLQFKLKSLPPLNACTASSCLAINILCTPSSVTEAFFSAYSWCKHVGHLYAIRIVVDGAFDAKIKPRLASLIPGAEIVTASSLIDLNPNEFSALCEFGKAHPLGRKLLLALSLQQSCDFIYSDNDVLLFSYPTELVNAISHGQPVYNQESGPSCYDRDLLVKADQLGLKACKGFNSGLFYSPAGSINLNYCNALAEAKKKDAYTWFDEQTVLAVAMGEACAIPLSKESYVINTKRQFWSEQDVDYTKITTRHFTGPVRHLMYSSGYAQL
jgi:hypothetical protein